MDNTFTFTKSGYIFSDFNSDIYTNFNINILNPYEQKF
tara:strand:+ start:62 stop:175 length:114 start_codon:yes stop_codon:yes gene_type:complete